MQKFSHTRVATTQGTERRQYNGTFDPHEDTTHDKASDKVAYILGNATISIINYYHCVNLSISTNVRLQSK